MDTEKQIVYIVEHGVWHPYSWNDCSIEKVFNTQEKTLDWISAKYPEYMDHDGKGVYFQGPVCKYIYIHKMEIE